MENLKQLKMSFRFFNTFYFKFLVFIIELFQAAFLLVFFFGLLATAKLRYSQKFTVLWVLKGRPLGTFYLALSLCFATHLAENLQYTLFLFLL